MNHDKLDELLRILVHPQLNGVADRMNAEKERYTILNGDITFTDIIFRFIRETRVCNKNRAQTKALVLRADLKMMFNSFLLDSSVCIEDKYNIHKMEKLIEEWLDYGFLNSILDRSKEKSVIVPTVKKAGPGRPKYEESTNGFPFAILVKDACLLWDAVSNFWNDLIKNLKENDYQITSEKVKTMMMRIDDDMPKEHCRVVRGYTILFHLFTHRFLDKDDDGNFLYEIPPIRFKPGSVLDFKFEGIDDRFLIKSANGIVKCVWHEEGRFAFRGTTTLSTILEDANHDEDIMKNMKSDNGLFSPDHSNVGNLFLFVREILVMNKEKRWWHLRKIQNYIRQQRSRFQQLRTQSQPAAIGTSFFERFMWLRSLPEIQKLHPGATEPVDQKYLEKIGNSLVEQMRRHDRINQDKEIDHLKKGPIEKVKKLKKRKSESSSKTSEKASRRRKTNLYALKGMYTTIITEASVVPRIIRNDALNSFEVDEYSKVGTYWTEVFKEAYSNFENQENESDAALPVLRGVAAAHEDSFHDIDGKYMRGDYEDALKIYETLCYSILEVQDATDQIVNSGESSFQMTESECKMHVAMIRELKSTWHDVLVLYLCLSKHNVII
jgi:hypothetical protein